MGNRGLSNQRGQGVLEYILVLAVTVVLILGGVYQLNSAFASWAQNYFGEYLACLLETGELPSLGGENSAAGICNENYEAFSLDAGRPLKGNPIGSPGGGNASGSPSGPSRSGTAEGRGGSSSGRSRQIAVRGGSGRGGGGMSFGGGRGGRGGGGAGGGRFDSGEGGDSFGGAGILRIPGSGSSGGSATGREARLYSSSFGVSPEEESERSAPMVSPKKPSEAKVDRNERLKVVRKPATVQAPKSDERMTFGGFIRLLIIAAIIIALVVFLGGQALQMRKSLD